MAKKCWICGEEIKESTTPNEPTTFYGQFHLITVNKPFAKNFTWKGGGWICQECMIQKIGVDHNGKQLN